LAALIPSPGPCWTGRVASPPYYRDPVRLKTGSRVTILFSLRLMQRYTHQLRETRRRTPARKPKHDHAFLVAVMQLLPLPNCQRATNLAVSRLQRSRLHSRNPQSDD